MNPIQNTISERLAGLSPLVAPLVDACQRYLPYCSAIDTEETVLIGHRPWVAPENYLFRLYPGAKKAWFGKYEQMNGLVVPPTFRPLLLTVNGFFAFGVSIYGMSPSMLKMPPSINRRSLECHDFRFANESWKGEFPIPGEYFHFGSRHDSYSQLAGFFLTGKGTIAAHLKSGRKLGEWDDLTVFLREELSASEGLEMKKTPIDWWH